MRLFKTVKTSLFTLILTLLAIGTYAAVVVMNDAKPVKAEGKLLLEIWYFTGTDPLNPNHYSQPTSPPPCDAVKEQICSIEAENNSGKPLLTTARQNDIQDVLDAFADPLEEPMVNNTVKAFKSL